MFSCFVGIIENKNNINDLHVWIDDIITQLLITEYKKQEGINKSKLIVLIAHSKKEIS